MPKGTKLPFTSPEGRLVQGDAFVMNTKDKAGNLRVVKSGPNIGQPAPQMVVCVAYAKTDPAWPAHEAQLKGKAAEDFPQFFPNAARGDFTATHPNFSFKIMDGDGVDGDGKPNNVKEGWAGHWVVRYTSGYPAKVYNKGHYAPQEQVFKEEGKPAPGPRRGDHVRVGGTIEGNNDLARPSIYANCSMIEFSRPGIEIISGPNAEMVFGAGGAVNYAGVTGTVATPPPVPPAAPAGLVAAAGIDLAAYRASGWTDDQLVAAGHATRPAPVTPPPAPPAPPAPPSPPSPPAPPYTGYREGAPPPPAPAAPVRQMTAAAQGLTYEQYIASGWDDAMLIQHGMMVPN